MEPKEMMLTDAIQTALKFSRENLRLKCALYLSISFNLALVVYIIFGG